MARETAQGKGGWGTVGAPLVCTTLVGCAITAIFFVAPTEKTMGVSQRIMYVHVPVAWLGLLGFVTAATSGGCYLARRDLRWDRWLQSAVELGWLCSTLTLMTGSLWARSAWNTWWTWEPRLTSAFILWAIYSGILIIRQSQEDAHRRARISAVLAVVGLLDIPMVVMATRWFRGMHPVSPQMEPAMRAVLLLSAVSMTAFFGMLLARRRAQLDLESAVAVLEQGGGRFG
jgi:heme exporter protein C